MTYTKRHSSILLLLLGTLACRGAEEANGPSDAELTAAVVTVCRETVDLRHTASATVRGSQTAVLASKAPAYVQEIRFQPGDHVRAGQVLFVLEDQELGAKLRAAQAGVEEARQALTEAESGLKAAEAQAGVATARYERFQSLQEKRAVAPQEYDEVEAGYLATLAQKDMASARLRRVQSALARAEAELVAVESYTRVTAPFSGRVTERHVDVGNLVTPGASLGVIEQEGNLRAVASIPETYAGRIEVGDRATVWLEGASQPVESRVSEVNQGVDVQSRAFIVLADLLEEASSRTDLDLRPGRFVRIDFIIGETTRLLIPSSAVFERGQLEMVYVVEDGKARSRLVTVGRQHGDRLEVLSGLSEGEVIVTDPGAELEEGVLVVSR